jgi:hypothetical protein
MMVTIIFCAFNANIQWRRYFLLVLSIRPFFLVSANLPQRIKNVTKRLKLLLRALDRILDKGGFIIYIYSDEEGEEMSIIKS